MPLENPNRRYFDLGQGGNPYPPQQPRTLGQMAPPPQQGFTPQPESPDFQTFGQNVLTLLKRYQQQGKMREAAGQQEQVQRATQALPQDLASARLSPSQIRGFRQGEIEAVEPTIGGARSLVAEAESVIKEYQASQERAQARMQDNVNAMINTGNVEGLKALPPEAIKLAGYDQKTLTGIVSGLEKKAQADAEAKETFSTVDLGDRVGVFDQKGNLIKTIPKGVPPKAPKGGFTTTVSGRPFVARDELTTAEQQLVDQISAAEKLVNQVEGLYKSAVGEEYAGTGSGVAARLKGITRGLGRAVGTNEASKQYKSFVESNLSIIARGLKGEVGVLTNQDITRARGALPTGFSSPAEADTAFRTLRQQMKDNISVYGQFADEDPNVWEKIPGQ